MTKTFLLSLFTLLIGACGLPAQNFTPEDIKNFKTKELVYKQIDTTQLKLSIVYPHDLKSGDKRPAIVFFYGGGWNQGSLSQFLTHSLELAHRGMIAIMADYRVKKRHHTTPKECVSDARSAMRYVRAHAKELGINPEMIAAAGGSAGGHLAAATAVIDAFDDKKDDKSVDPSPNALILFNPVLDNGPDGGWAYDRVKDYYQQISPAHNIKPNLPPTLFMVGTIDKLIPVATAIRYQENMKKAGNKCDLYLYASQGHSFFNYKNGDNPYYYRTLDAMIAFLRSLNFIQ